MLELRVDSEGFDSTVDITGRLLELLQTMQARNGLVSVMVVGSTAGLAIMRYEPGAVADLMEGLERAAPSGHAYQHLATTGDPNGASHIRSALIGSSVCVPFIDGKLGMSPLHNIVLLDFDLRASSRLIYVQPHGGWTQHEPSAKEASS